MARGRGRADTSGQQTAVAPRATEVVETVVAPTPEATAHAENRRIIRQAEMIIWRFESRRTELMRAKGDALADSHDLLDLDIKAAGILEAREQRTLASAAQLGDDRARHLLTVCNQRAIHAFSRKFQGRGLSLEELLQEGNVGMQTAIDRYDPSNPASFLTYAAWWVRQAVMQAIEQKGSQQRVPSYLHQVLQRTQISLRSLEGKGVHAPTRQQIVDEVQSRSSKPVPEDHIYTSLDLIGRRYVSLDAHIGEDDGSSIGDVIPDERIDFHEEIDEAARTGAIAAALKVLTPLQRTVITRRYGLEGHTATPGIELQKELGMTKGSLGSTIKTAQTRMRAVLEDRDARDLIHS
ncbi:sigma-70 family RNA polymerase sigma factor [Miltoncostaea oceani]|uniref:sigma-70 family RNA polymerase sigma factor n=1 Tax=Miltoncostaea oceani TaxID=2843216 RepID=UPI001C3CEDDC|nr:sigma-70 family RNA polymerase sigma factor [Miltoncostaea oceani]